MTDRRTDLERALFEELDFLFAQRDDPTNQHLSQLARRPYALQGLAKLAARLDALPAPATAETDQRRKAEIAICEAARHATGPCESHADLVGRLDALRMRWCEALTLRIYAEAKAAMTGRPRRYQRIGRPSERARS